MPVENELPWVLDDPDGQLEAHMATSPDWQGYDVVQGYASKNARVRRFSPLDGRPAWHEFSYKQKVDGRQIEVEVPMSAADFQVLLGTCELVMTKRRFKQEVGEVTWDVDFCKDTDRNTYFVRAEAEMPEGAHDYGPMPQCVAEHVILAIQRVGGFGNRALCDVEAAKVAMEKIRKAARKAGTEPRRRASAYAEPPESSARLAA
jgi:CYTH domain-containing protein